MAAAPSLSVAVIETVWESSGPSVVSNDQLQAPSPRSTIVPAEAVRVTASPPGSEYVPVLVAVAPSAMVIDSSATVIAGGRLTISMVAWATALTAPALSVQRR